MIRIVQEINDVSNPGALRQEFRNLHDKLTGGVKVIKDGHKVKGINEKTGDKTIVPLSAGEIWVRENRASEIVKILKGDL